ncbi:hypothetical protein BO71DRAFT_486422 [Aspergillus ellipticus CBS 707.79]|uniref:Uncharacterized protein n=1 Tax=Aspergillus ellipticus CBS 707.79 TaxID=1448320 RepID=A0A319D219_9EURO|nr:hypothetical protein BO71DRAFT_486422 [Aspergillus ellipticus CBS 707.79]
MVSPFLTRRPMLQFVGSGRHCLVRTHDLKPNITNAHCAWRWPGRDGLAGVGHGAPVMADWGTGISTVGATKLDEMGVGAIAAVINKHQQYGTRLYWAFCGRRQIMRQGPFDVPLLLSQKPTHSTSTFVSVNSAAQNWRESQTGVDDLRAIRGNRGYPNLTTGMIDRTLRPVQNLQTPTEKPVSAEATLRPASWFWPQPPPHQHQFW